MKDTLPKKERNKKKERKIAFLIATIIALINGLFEAYFRGSQWYYIFKVGFNFSKLTHGQTVDLVFFLIFLATMLFIAHRETT